jgi:hypothetical protein
MLSSADKILLLVVLIGLIMMAYHDYRYEGRIRDLEQQMSHIREEVELTTAKKTPVIETRGHLRGVYTD